MQKKTGQEFKDKPIISPNAYNQVSDFRKAQLQKEANNGMWRDGSVGSVESKMTPASYLATEVGTNKYAQSISTSGTTGSGDWRGQGGTFRQMPDIYSPLWLNSNLNLPRDRATMNAWCRSFFALQSFVQNAINLHSTYPISKLNIKCADPKQENFFNDMMDEIGLQNFCTEVAQEYWLLGEAFPQGVLDENNAKWRKFSLQNPDYIVIKGNPVHTEPVIMMRPDPELRRIVFSPKPSDVQQRRQLDPTIVEHIKRGENIPLDSFYITHLARKMSPYDPRGTGLPVSCFRQLMLFDVARECFSEDTEVLTNQGFKNFAEVINFTETSMGIISSPNQNVKIACFNKDNEQLEYHAPTDSIVKEYDGEMINFVGEKLDVLVTPGHNMLVSERRQKNYKNIWDDWKLQSAESILTKKKNYKFRSHSKWEGRGLESVDMLGKSIPIKDYLKFIGYVLSEGCIYTDFTKDPDGNCRKNRYDALVSVNQIIESSCIDDIKNNFNLIAKLLGKDSNNSITPADPDKNHKIRWNARMHGKDIVEYVKNELGLSFEEKATAYNKKIPRWILELNPELLKILLESLVNGDGTINKSKYNEKTESTQYCTVSKQLADDVYELAYKCGYVPNICVHKRELDGRPEYYVLWSNTQWGREPSFLVGNKKENGAQAKKQKYKGKVWCLTVPTGLFITRRNNKITIQGNCKYVQFTDLVNPVTLVKIGDAEYKPQPEDLEAWRNAWAQSLADKNFKIFTHQAVSVERIGANSAILDTSNDITQLLKEIFMGLMVPEVVMTGGGDISYNNGGISLDVLRQRYMQFRNMMAAWLKNKVFAPIARLNDFYEYVNGEKKLIVPEVEWNRLTMFDTMDYINILLQLSTDGPGKRVSKETLYDSLGLELEEERRKIRREDIYDVIRKKEQANLEKMTLNELRAISDDDEIPEITDTANPNDSPYDTGAAPLPGTEPSGAMPGGSGIGGLPDLGGLGGGLSGGLGGGLSTPPISPTSAAPSSGGGGNAPPAPPV